MAAKILMIAMEGLAGDHGGASDAPIMILARVTLIVPLMTVVNGTRLAATGSRIDVTAGGRTNGGLSRPHD